VFCNSRCQLNAYISYTQVSNWGYTDCGVFIIFLQVIHNAKVALAGVAQRDFEFNLKVMLI